MDLEKYLQEINKNQSDPTKNFKNRAYTQDFKPQNDPFIKNGLRNKTQNYNNVYPNSTNKYPDDRAARDKIGEKGQKLERAKTKEPYVRPKKEDSFENNNKKKKDFDKFLDDDFLQTRKSKVSLRNRQINDPFAKKFLEEPKVNLV